MTTFLEGESDELTMHRGSGSFLDLWFSGKAGCYHVFYVLGRYFMDLFATFSMVILLEAERL